MSNTGKPTRMNEHKVRRRPSGRGAKTKAWDEVWKTLDELQVGSINAEWKPYDKNSQVNWGKRVCDAITQLQEEGNLSAHEIYILADMFYSLVKAGRTQECS